MKVLTVSALVCAVMVLTGAAESHLVKRSNFCSSGWFPINGRWYYVVQQALSWAKAEKYCQSLGGNLASIHNLQEHQEIVKQTKSDTWIGGYDAQVEGQWFWSDGSPFKYSNWCSGEPDNSGGQHCSQIVHRESEKCWDDFDCTTEKPFLCVTASCQYTG